jgi:thiamine-phosphate pyrophosphorylase
MLGAIYGIADSVWLPSNTFLNGVEEALRGGVSCIQLRNKSKIPEALLPLATQLVKLCHNYNALCIINDHIQLARWSGADGVHLGQTDASIVNARKQLGAQAIIGITCHSDLKLAEQAEALGANYVAFGRFYASHTKPMAPISSLEVLTSAAAKLTIPIVAIGGITSDNMAPIVHAGAHTLAVSESLFGCPPICDAARNLVAQYQSCLSLK